MKQHIQFSKTSLLYAFRIVLGCLIVWALLHVLEFDKTEWAIISVIVVSEPDFGHLQSATFSRVVNTVMGCFIGMIFLSLTGINYFSFILAVTASVLISTSFKRYPASWKLAPVTVAIIMIPTIIEHQTWEEAMETAFTRTAEVLLGCVVAYALGLVFPLIRSFRGNADDENRI